MSVHPATSNQVRPLLIVMSSDDHYGSDRMLTEVLASLSETDRARAVVWLPLDYKHGSAPLCERLAEGAIAFEHVDLPIMRRRYLNPRGLAALLKRAVSVRARIGELNPSDILLGTSATLPVAPMVPRRLRANVVLYMQEVWQGKEARILGAMARRVDRIITISKACRTSLPESLQARTVIVPNSTPEPARIEPLATHTGPLRFVVAGRWNPGKGHDVLLQAWDRAGSPGHLVILGGPPAMGTAVDVPSLVRAADEPDSVSVVGEVSDVGPYIDEADVMVVPSTIPEGFGLVTIEAFARQRPVVATALGGSQETVADGAGWLVAADSVDALAERLSGLTRTEVAAAGEAARRRYEELYSRAAFQNGFRAAFDDRAAALEPDHELITAGMP